MKVKRKVGQEWLRGQEVIRFTRSRLALKVVFVKDQEGGTKVERKAEQEWQ